jgi:hypothetical protein
VSTGDARHRFERLRDRGRRGVPTVDVVRQPSRSLLRAASAIVALVAALAIGADPQLSSGHLDLGYWFGLDAKDRALGALLKHAVGGYQRVWETDDGQRLFIWAIEFDDARSAQAYVDGFQTGGDHRTSFKVPDINGAVGSAGDNNGIVVEQIGFALDTQAFTVILAGNKDADHAGATAIAVRQHQRALDGPPVETASTIAPVPSSATNRIGSEEPDSTTAAPAPKRSTPGSTSLLRQGIGGAIVLTVFVVVVRVNKRRREARAHRNGEHGGSGARAPVAVEHDADAAPPVTPVPDRSGAVNPDR